MLDRLKRTLVESFVGAIALGWLFGDITMNFARYVSVTVASWLARGEYRGLRPGPASPSFLSLRDGLPDLAKSFFLLLVWYVLLRWLYFKPLEEEASEPVPDPEPEQAP
ncbi:MAG: hypothetical protein ABSG25_02265 [Bryobacteraceae bacterium]